VITAKTPPPDNTRTRTDLGKNQSNDQRLRTRTARLLTPGRRSRRPTPRRHRDRQSATARRPTPSLRRHPAARRQDAAAAIARRHPAVTGRPNAATPSPAVAQRQASRRRSPPQTARPTPGRKSSSV
jgi:hypothetical protein